MRLNNYMANKLRPHRGHYVQIACYGDWNDPHDICVECETCGEVLISAEDYEEQEDE